MVEQSQMKNQTVRSVDKEWQRKQTKEWNECKAGLHEKRRRIVLYFKTVG
jgi:hypothetical protein